MQMHKDRPLMNQPYNVFVPVDVRLEKTLPFELRELSPVRVMSSLYPWLRGHLVIEDHPYFATTDSNGNFEIKNIPKGTWKFRTWHERAGYLQKVVRGMTKETWKRGQFELTIKKGDNNIREIYIPPTVFRPT